MTSPIIPIHLSIQARKLLRTLEFAFSPIGIWFETFQIKLGSKGISSWNCIVFENMILNNDWLHFSPLNLKYTKINISTKTPNYSKFVDKASSF